jgi:hypothetical protein
VADQARGGGLDVAVGLDRAARDGADAVEDVVGSDIRLAHRRVGSVPPRNSAIASQQYLATMLR